MCPPSVAIVEDGGDSVMSPLLPRVDNNAVKVTPTPLSDGPAKHQSSSSSSTTEERLEKQLPPPPPGALVQSPSTSALSTSNYLKDQIIAFFQVSDNKLAMKLFGNKTALMREKLRQRAVGNWVIHPCSNFRQVFLASRTSTFT